MAVVSSIALLVTEHRSSKLDTLRMSLSYFVDPLKYVVDLPSSGIQRASESLSSYASLLKENADLRDQQLSQQAKLLKFEALEKENVRLRALLEHAFKLGEQVLIADILAVNTKPYEHILVVNKGSHFGIQDHQPVLDANGVVGQVFRSMPLTSEIILITDPNHIIPVQVNRNGLLTFAVGTGKLDRLDLPYLPSNADIQPGDLLITSGLGGTFPKGYPVAVVNQFTSQPDKQSPQNVTAIPKSLLDRNRELMIVWSNSSPIPLFPKTTSNETNIPTATPKTPSSNE